MGGRVKIVALPDVIPVVNRIVDAIGHVLTGKALKPEARKSGSDNSRR